MRQLPFIIAALMLAMPGIHAPLQAQTPAPPLRGAIDDVVQARQQLPRPADFEALPRLPAVPGLPQMDAAETPQTRQEALPPAPDKKGLPAGAFRLRLRNEVQALYASDADEAGLRLAPSLRLESNWPRHRLQLSWEGEALLWQKSPHEASADIAADLRLDVRRDVWLDARLAYGLDQLQEGSDVLEHVIEARNTLGVRRHPLQLELSGGARRRFLTRSSGNDDYTEPFIALRGSIEHRGLLRPYAEIGADVRLYDAPRDAAGVKRNSRGGHVQAGIVLRPSAFISGELGLKLAARWPDADNLETLWGAGLVGKVNWQPRYGTKLGLAASFELEDDDTTGRRRKHVLTLSAEQQLRRSLSANAELEGEYLDASGGDDTLTLRLRTTLAWQFWRHVALIGSWEGEKALLGASLPMSHTFGLGLRQEF